MMEWQRIIIPFYEDVISVVRANSLQLPRVFKGSRIISRSAGWLVRWHSLQSTFTNRLASHRTICAHESKHVKGGTSRSSTGWGHMGAHFSAVCCAALLTCHNF